MHDYQSQGSNSSNHEQIANTHKTMQRARSLNCRKKQLKDDFSGWLRKQGTKIKQSKRRFFVLDGPHLLCYTASDKLRLVASIRLDEDPIVIEFSDLDITQDRSCQYFPFTIRTKDETKLLSGTKQSSLTLEASSKEERHKWIRAIYKNLYLRKGGALFGTSLLEQFNKFSSNSPETQYLPSVVYDCMEYLRKHGMQVEGIFRKCGQQNTIRKMADAYDTCQPRPILEPRASLSDIHVVAGLLKLYLRETPEPVIPTGFYEKLKQNYCNAGQADQQQLEQSQHSCLIETLANLPGPNYNLLLHLSKFLFEVSRYHEQNKMTVDNLACIFAPNIFRSSAELYLMEVCAVPSTSSNSNSPTTSNPPSSLLGLTNKQDHWCHRAMVDLILHHSEILRQDPTMLVQMHKEASKISPNPRYSSNGMPVQSKISSIVPPSRIELESRLSRMMRLEEEERNSSHYLRPHHYMVPAQQRCHTTSFEYANSSFASSAASTDSIPNNMRSNISMEQLLAQNSNSSAVVANNNNNNNTAMMMTTSSHMRHSPSFSSAPGSSRFHGYSYVPGVGEETGEMGGGGGPRLNGFSPAALRRQVTSPTGRPGNILRMKQDGRPVTEFNSFSTAEATSSSSMPAGVSMSQLSIPLNNNNNNNTAIGNSNAVAVPGLLTPRSSPMLAKTAASRTCFIPEDKVAGPQQPPGGNFMRTFWSSQIGGRPRRRPSLPQSSFENSLLSFGRLCQTRHLTVEDKCGICNHSQPSSPLKKATLADLINNQCEHQPVAFSADGKSPPPNNTSNTPLLFVEMKTHKNNNNNSNESSGENGHQESAQMTARQWREQFELSRAETAGLAAKLQQLLNDQDHTRCALQMLESANMLLVKENRCLKSQLIRNNIPVPDDPSLDDEIEEDVDDDDDDNVVIPCQR